MNSRAIVCGFCFLLTAMAAKATPVLTVGTPANNQLSTPTSASPQLGGTTLKFDTLTPFTSYSSYSSNGVTISSPDGLLVLPYSTQSGPNELYDNSADGSASLLISLASGTTAIGIGIADSDPVTLSFQALGANGALLGSAILENLLVTQNAINTGNGYYVLQNTTADIYGLRITEAVGNANYSGLAIDDVQVAATPVAATPEPASLSLLALGLCGLAGFTYVRRFKQA